MNKQSQKKKSEKHKLTSECFNSCVEWKLNASVLQNKTSLGYIFLGKSLFFKKLDASILNMMQNNYNTKTSESQDGNTASNGKKNIIKDLEEKSNKQLNETQVSKNFTDEGGCDISNIKFPIDNSQFNFMIIDANLGISDNLNNLFFLEFDLTNTISNKEKLKFLREINNDCVEKEMFFVLNGTIHGVPIFKQEISFSVETRKFIKSMQFRLETYKNDLIEKKIRLNKSGEGNKLSNYIKNIFYTKILSNTNIGIEFFKPSFEPFAEKFPTNFNSIVNSNILLNKIYLEVCIPKIFINNGLSLSVTKNNKINNQDKEKASSSTKKNQKTQSPGGKNLKISTEEQNQYHNLPGTKKIHTCTNFPHVNNFNSPTNGPAISVNKPFSSKPSSPINGFRNGVGLGGNIPPLNTVRSPEYLRKNVNLSLNYMNLNSPGGMYYNNTNNNYPFPSLSPTSSTSSLMDFSSSSNNFNFNPLNNFRETSNGMSNANMRRFSESTYDKLKENPLSRMMNPNMSAGNNIRSPQLFMKINPDLYVPNLNPMNLNMNSNFMRSVHNNSGNFHNFSLNGGNASDFLPHKSVLNNGYISPRGYSNMPLNQQNLLNYSQNQMINKINETQQKGGEENKNENGETVSHTQKINLQNLFTHYEGLCNFHIFMKACTPHIVKKTSKNINQINISEFFKNFEKISAFGLDITYFEENEIIYTTYSPMLSSLEIKISDKETCHKIFEELKKINKNYTTGQNLVNIFDDSVDKEVNSQNYNIQNNYEYEFLIGDTNMKINIKNKQLKIEFYETKPPHSRQIFIKQIEHLLNNFEVLKTISIENIDKPSWFSILWNPVKSTRGGLMNTSFLTYYQFNILNESQNREVEISKIYSKFAEIPIIGILPIKLDNKIFLSLIKKQFTTGINSSFLFNSEFNHINTQNFLKNSIDNVFNLVISNSSRNSMDYEFYLKNSITII